MPTDKITSIAELKREIERIQMPTHITKEFVLGLINSFEAGLKERIEKMENSGITEKIKTSQNRFELRRVLGLEVEKHEL